MCDDEKLEEKYERKFSTVDGLQHTFSTSARHQMAQMVEEMAISDKVISQKIGTAQSIPVKAGGVAEEYHTHSFNMDAILKGDETRALNDNRAEWNQHEWKGQKLKTNDTPDIVLVKDGKVTKTYQAKYYQDSNTTTKQMSQVKDGKVKYEDIDSLLGPSDQVKNNGIKKTAEHHYDVNKSHDGDPVKREAYKQTRDKVTDTVEDGNASSRRLTKKQAESLGKGNKKQIDNLNSEYQTASTLQQVKNASIGAASMSAIVSGATNTTRYLILLSEGKITPEEATLKIIGETVSSAADSAVKAGANAGIQSLIVRYGSKEAAIAALAKQGLQTMMQTNAVTVGVTCAIDAVKDLVRYASGSITADQFFERQGKNVMSTSVGVTGGALGTTAATSAATFFGASTGTTVMTVASLAGGFVGGLIAGIATSLAIENGIEKPYRQLMEDTQYTREAMQELERVSQTMMLGQMVFTRFVESHININNQIDEQLRIGREYDRSTESILNRIRSKL